MNSSRPLALEPSEPRKHRLDGTTIAHDAGAKVFLDVENYRVKMLELTGP